MSLLGLDATELRVLGALVEKSQTTPDQYPLTVNALRNACNQKSSRDPIMALSERDVQQGLRALQERKLVRESLASGRTVRWEHRAREVLEVSPSEMAALCILMLRGPQTPGEIRSRSSRLFDFVDRADVERTIERLATREPPMVTQLSRAPGQKEQRFAHLLGDKPPVAPAVARPRPTAPQPERHHTGLDAAVETRLQLLEERVAELEQLVAAYGDSGRQSGD